MDAIFPNANVKYRAINSPPFHHLVYITIISIEIIAALICWWELSSYLKISTKMLWLLIKAKNGQLSD